MRSLRTRRASVRVALAPASRGCPPRSRSCQGWLDVGIHKSYFTFEAALVVKRLRFTSALFNSVFALLQIPHKSLELTSSIEIEHVTIVLEGNSFFHKLLLKLLTKIYILPITSCGKFFNAKHLGILKKTKVESNYIIFFCKIINLAKKIGEKD